METALLVVSLIALVAMLIAAAARERGRRRESKPLSPAGPALSSSLPEIQATEAALHGQDAPVLPEHLTLTPVPGRHEDLFLAQGTEVAIGDFESTGLGIRERSTDVSGILSKGVIGIGGVLEKVASDRNAGRLVRVTEESMKQIQQLGPNTDSAGKMLGVLKDSQGKFAHVVRLESAGNLAAANPALLALSAGIMIKLEGISRKLDQIMKMLDWHNLVIDFERFASIVAANEELLRLYSDIQRRGVMTDADMTHVKSMSLEVTSQYKTAEAILDYFVQEDLLDENRKLRKEHLKELVEEFDVQYWVSCLVYSQLAFTRRDLLHLYWEAQHHPESVGPLVESIQDLIVERQERMVALGQFLTAVANPESVSDAWTDRFRLFSKWDLEQYEELFDEILGAHGDLFPKRVGRKKLSAPSGDSSITLAFNSSDRPTLSGEDRHAAEPSRGAAS